MCLMLCAPLDWQYAECGCGSSNQIEKKKKNYVNISLASTNPNKKDYAS